MTWFPRYVRLTLSRLWMRDLVYFGTKAMVMGGSTSLQVSAVAMKRRSQQPLISWNAILIKAIALASKKWPVLKRAYIPYPWPHLYEHPHCIVSVTIEREWGGEPAVFFDQIHDPESKTLREIDFELRGLKLLPVEAVGGYRRLIRIARFPLPLRRLMWWIGLYWSGRLKARYFGTFSLNPLPSRRGRITQSVTPVTLSFQNSPIQPGGDMPCQIFIDHRVMDGGTVDRFCAELQLVLDRDIVAELSHST